MSDGVRTCVSCTHFKGPENIYMQRMQLPNHDAPTCEHPQAASRDMIYGKAYCQNERNDKKGCGKQGKLWVSKDNANKS
jgi:hypothetical protein